MLCVHGETSESTHAFLVIQMSCVFYVTLSCHSASVKSTCHTHPVYRCVVETGSVQLYIRCLVSVCTLSWRWMVPSGFLLLFT